MQRLRSWGLGFTAIASGLAGLTATELAAQTTAARSGARIRSAAPVNACIELRTSPTALVHAPEGMALLRLKRELESAALTLEKEQQLESMQLQRLSQVQRGMDSLMQVVVRHFREDGTPGPTVTVRRGDPLRVVDGRTIDAPRLFGSVDSTVRIMVPTMDSTLRTMSPQVVSIIRSLQPQVAAFVGEAETRIVRSTVPAGYVGVSLSGAQLRTVTPEGVLTSHCEYPLVETVDVGSPAARAGLNAGDTLTGYNGRDVLQIAVNYPELLVPGETVRMRVRRGGRSREVPVVIAPRLDDESGRITAVRRVPAPATPLAPPTPLSATASGAGLVLIAGAQFAPIDEEFAQRLGVEPGMLVLRVPPGTPAADAGLRAGDVVRAVNGTAVRDANGLRRAMSSREARLLVHSKPNGTRTVLLRGRE
jgi:hypothetical protein